MSSMQTERELAPQEFEFEAMNLQVGIRLQFITYRRIKPMQYFSTLIGYVKDEYLIVKVPLENGMPVGLVEGERITIRVFSGMNVCSFACTVRASSTVPCSTSTCPSPTRSRAPACARRCGSRSTSRPRCCRRKRMRRGRLHAHQSQRQRRAHRVKPQPAGRRRRDRLEFGLTSPMDDKEMRVRTRAAVRNVNALRRDADGTEMFAYGVQFLELDPVHFTMLQNLTYEVLLADRQKIV